MINNLIQVRIEGTVSKVSEEESCSYFEKRPKPNQVGAVVSRQSQVVSSRQVTSRFLSFYFVYFCTCSKLRLKNAAEKQKNSVCISILCYSKNIYVHICLISVFSKILMLILKT